VKRRTADKETTAELSTAELVGCETTINIFIIVRHILPQQQAHTINQSINQS